jgi:hypothetical protein
MMSDKQYERALKTILGNDAADSSTTDADPLVGTCSHPTCRQIRQSLENSNKSLRQLKGLLQGQIDDLKTRLAAVTSEPRP